MAVRIVGLDKVLKDLESKNQDVLDAVGDVLEQVAKDIEINASQDAPAFVPQIPEIDLNIGARIEAKPTEFIKGTAVTWDVFVKTDPDNELTFFDGYMEFNTGLEAAELLSNPNYSPEIKALAEKYLGKIRPRTGTLRGKPYFFPNVFRFTANLEEKLTKAINDNIK
jgi:hypothetical protein